MKSPYHFLNVSNETKVSKRQVYGIKEYILPQSYKQTFLDNGQQAQTEM